MSDSTSWMTPLHPRWDEFCDRLAGPEGCNFQGEDGDTSLPDGWQPHEWAYLKGIASGAIWSVHARLLMGGK